MDINYPPSQGQAKLKPTQIESFTAALWIATTSTDAIFLNGPTTLTLKTTILLFSFQPQAIGARELLIQFVPALVSKPRSLEDIEAELSFSPVQSSSAARNRNRSDSIENPEDIFSTPPSQPSTCSRYHLSNAPPSPKRIRIDASRGEVELDYRDGSPSPLTPPPSSQRHGNGFVKSEELTGAESPTKGKGKANGWDGHWLGTSSNEETLSQDTSASLLGYQARSQFVENSGGVVIGSQSEFTADSISLLVDSLAGVPRYVRKLERKQKAAEKSSEAKAKRILDLEKEIQLLRAKNQVLEGTIQSMNLRQL